MKKSYLFIALLFIPFFLLGQETNNTMGVKHNTFYIEAFGQGLLSSLNYDRLFRVDRNVRNSFSIGLAFTPVDESLITGLPLSYNFIWGHQNSHLELGIGLTLLRIKDIVHIGNQDQYNVTGTETNYYTYFSPKISYRYQNSQGGLFLKAGIAPMFAIVNRIAMTNEQYFNMRPGYEYFENVCGFGYSAFPWFGISLGYTFKD